MNNNSAVGVGAKSVDPEESCLQCQKDWELDTVSLWMELDISSDYPTHEK